jgi:two-component system phosphate regulon sensor histidine kinase PhoR
MKKSIILRNLFVVLIALLIIFFFSLIAISEINKSLASENVIRISKIYNQKFETQTIEQAAVLPSSIFYDTRLTVIAINGEVLYDSFSDNADMENHLGREEIQNALKGAPKSVVRFSDTLNIKMLYYAEKIDGINGELIIRVAIPYSLITTYLENILPVYFLVIIIVLFSTYFISDKLSKKIIEPIGRIKQQISDINSGEYSKLADTEFNDLNNIISEINIISKNLSSAFSKASIERNKMLFILNSLAEGIIAVDKNDDIIILNEYAKKLFGVNDKALFKNVSILSEKDELITFFKYYNEVEKTKLEVNYKTFNFIAKKLKNFDEDIKLIILSDVTDEEQSEKFRSAFFANAGHELKTPITSIRGFSELLSIQKLDEKSKSYSDKINSESLRLVSLIDDMLMLSKLENKKTEFNKEIINIEEVAEDCIKNLESQALIKNVKINVLGKAKVYFDREQLNKVLINLIENAIKYNIDNGIIDIIISDKKYPELIVKDTGIGIEKQHLSRIFERFYRIDKGRSKKTGGTGLGLSIVKHILIDNGAEITVNSKEGEGTIFTIKFKN